MVSGYVGIILEAVAPACFFVEVAKVSGRQGGYEIVDRYLAQALVLPVWFPPDVFPQGLDNSPSFLLVSQL